MHATPFDKRIDTQLELGDQAVATAGPQTSSPGVGGGTSVVDSDDHYRHHDKENGAPFSVEHDGQHSESKERELKHIANSYARQRVRLEV
jgi:hypothetical protein